MRNYSILALGLWTVSAWGQAVQPTDRPMDPDADPANAADAQSLIDSINEHTTWSITDLSLRDYLLYWDNDGTLPRLGKDNDRFYTNGNGIELSFDPHLTDGLKAKLAPANEWTDPRFGVGIAIKQLIFTSSDITDPAPPVTDHPYSGYLYLALSFQREDNTKRDHFELDLGIVGERAQGEMIQKFIHNAVPNQNDPQGWSSQLANELALNFTFERTWRTERAHTKGIEFEMLPAVGFDLGNVSTRARGRLTMRVGQNLPNDFGPASLLGIKDHTVNAANWGEGDWSFYIYTTLTLEAVARDIFLDGNSFAQSRSVNSEPFIALATAGVVARYKSVYLGWSQTYQTENFETQPSGQAWGSIVFGYSFKM